MPATPPPKALPPPHPLTAHTLRLRRFTLTWLLDGFAVYLTVRLLWANTVPYPDDFLIILLAWPMTGLLWLIRTGYLFYNARRRPASIWGHLPRLLLIPALAVASSAVTSSDALWQLRLQRSRPALDRAATLIMQNHPDAPHSGDRIGLYTVSVVHAVPGVVHLHIDGFGGWTSSCGLAYSPAGRPTDTDVGDGYYYHEHLGGYWYRYCYEW